tara:strand:- start:19 stop:789 length:771 start_codon:yes stop_codon:yes gene_type:complete
MGYKMKHKWQNMYSGMAADKLKFIQDTKSGDGKSMAKQTGTTPIDKDKLQKEAQDKANAAMKASEEKEVESDREGYRKYEKSGTGSAEGKTKFTPEGNKYYASLSPEEKKKADDKERARIAARNAKAYESRYKKIPEDPEPEPDPKLTASDRYAQWKKENPRPSEVKASDKQYAGTYDAKGRPVESQSAKDAYNKNALSDYNKNISNSKFVPLEEETKLSKGTAGETVLAKDLSKMAPAEIVAYNKAQKKANRKKS